MVIITAGFTVKLLTNDLSNHHYSVKMHNENIMSSYAQILLLSQINLCSLNVLLFDLLQSHLIKQSSKAAQHAWPEVQTTISFTSLLSHF